MTSAIGWYGPLVDLSEVGSHVGGFVQLLVFVHRSTPVLYKFPKGREPFRTDLQVGDDTRPFFSVSLWQKQMATKAVAGDVILLQNMKIAKFGHLVEARTVQCSSLLRLVHPYEALASKGVDDLIEECQVGKTATEKLRKVVKWVQQAGSALDKIGSHGFKPTRKLTRNWKVPEKSICKTLLSLSEVLHLTSPSKAIFDASVGEIFLPITWRALGDFEKEMFFSRRITEEDNSIVEDLICIGCQLCGSPLDSVNGSSKQNTLPLYCPKSSNHVHEVSLIYRPFMLYVWDESEHLPLLVKNKAAELLFGNIRAERVYSCYRGQKCSQISIQNSLHMGNVPPATGKEIVCSFSSDAQKSQEAMEKHHHGKNIDFYFIWMVLLKMLLQQGKNSPLRFEVTVNSSLDGENEKFEMVSMSIPCIATERSD